MEEGLIKSNNCSGNEYIAESFFLYAAISSGTASCQNSPRQVECSKRANSGARRGVER
jgi:hypothetical protein